MVRESTVRGGAAVRSALVIAQALAPARPARRAAEREAETQPARCRCGHGAEAHEHFRAGTDCGACGAQACGGYRAARRGLLRR